MSFPRHPPAQYRTIAGCRERLCVGCGRWWPWTIAYWYKDAGKPDGLQSRCIECVRPAMRERMRRKSAAQTQARQYARAARDGRVST